MNFQEFLIKRKEVRDRVIAVKDPYHPDRMVWREMTSFVDNAFQDRHYENIPNKFIHLIEKYSNA